MPFTRLRPLAVNIATMVPIGVTIMLAYFGVIHFFSRPTVFEHARMEGPDTVRADAVITINYDVTRRQSCTIVINRVAELKMPKDRAQRINIGRQWVLQTLVQTFRGDGFTRPSGYMVQLDTAMPEGRYAVFSRVRYHCDLLDYIWPRVVDMESVMLTVEN